MAKENVTEMVQDNGKEQAQASELNGRYPILKVRREKFEASDGREMWGYFVSGKVRGRDVKANFVARDKGSGGYALLDIIFDGKDTADLVMHDEVMVDKETGKVTEFIVYEIQDVDESTGVVYSYKVKPYRETDKSYINIMIAEMRAKQTAGKN